MCSSLSGRPHPSQRQRRCTSQAMGEEMGVRQSSERSVLGAHTCMYIHNVTRFGKSALIASWVKIYYYFSPQKALYYVSLGIACSKYERFS